MFKPSLLILLFFAQFTIAAGIKDGSEIQPDNFFPKVKLETNMGDITVELDRYKAPITVNNFLRYVAHTSYDDTLFHRVIGGFVAQGGGYDVEYKEKPSFGTIFNESGNGLKNNLYTIAMAREDSPHTATRQFFFNMNNNQSLDPGRRWGYAVFGLVTEGQEVLDVISEVETEYNTTANWRDVPIEPVILHKATVLPEVIEPVQPAIEDAPTPDN